MVSFRGTRPAGRFALWATACAAIVATTASDAAADLEELNYLAGPVIGFSFGNRSGTGGGLLGLEAGAGLGPERVNIGIEHRDDESFGYLELDPWYVVGASFGFGVGSETGAQPVLGLWEGIPLTDNLCRGEDERITMVTIAAGYRYTGVHEFYITPKVGTGPSICFD
jgi:hypothetical protein